MERDEDFGWGETSDNTNTDPFADDDDFFSTPEEDNIWQDEPLPNHDNLQQDFNEQEVFTKPHQKSPLGFKAVAGIIVVFLIVLALTLTFIDKLSVTKKVPPPPTEAQQQMQQGAKVEQQVEQNPTENTDFSDKGGKYDEEGTPKSESIKVDEKINTQDAQKVTKPSNNGGMTELPNDVAVDYSGDLFESSGTIHNKIKYLENSQVVYCLELKANIGDRSKLIKYYCGYNTFNSVDEGDTVKVSYQVVSDTCYSVNTISK